MKYLLDTNVFSETIRSHPNVNVKKWLETMPSEALYISVLTLGEVRRGIEKLGDGKRKHHLITWLEHDLPIWFGRNLLPINLEVAERWGYITAIPSQPPLTAIDALLAATALVYNLKMVTRNVKDFEVPGLEVVNPFE